MIFIPIVLFALAALLGITLLSYVLRGKFTPKAITIFHGSFAALGLVSLIALAVYSPYKLWLSVIIFTLAACGGFYLLFKDITGRVPKLVAVVHGLLAVTGFFILILSVFHFYPLPFDLF